MEYFEYKTIFFSTSIIGSSERMERILNLEGAKGWEFCGSHAETQEGDDGIRVIMKRSCKSVLEPYLSSGFSEDQLRQIFIALTGKTGRSTYNAPISTEALDYFLENAIDLFNEDHHALSHYYRKIVDGMGYDEAINGYKDYKVFKARNL